MKSEKHVALAQEIVVSCRKSVSFKGMSMIEISDETLLKEKISTALSQVERDALASKVVFPSEDLIKKTAHDYAYKATAEYKYEHFISVGFEWGCEWLRSQLTLAPNEQVIRVPKRKEYISVHPMFDDKVDGHNECLEAIKRLNPTATIEESNE